MGHYFGRIDSTVKVSEFRARLKKRSEHLHLKHEGAELSDRLAGLLQHEPLLGDLVLSSQLNANIYLWRFSACTYPLYLGSVPSDELEVEGEGGAGELVQGQHQPPVGGGHVGEAARPSGQQPPPRGPGHRGH